MAAHLCRVKRSLNEVGGMIHKAARGAGIPIGLADELAAAGVRLIGTGGAAAEVTQALTDETGVAFTGPAAIDAALCDRAEQRLSDVETPALLVAMVAARQVDVTAEVQGSDVVLKPGATQAEKPTGPVVIPDADWAKWDALAAKTYVPATEESRLSGAGAGLTDND